METIKIRAKINEIENNRGKKLIEKINKIDNPLARLTKIERKDTKYSIRNKTGDMTTNTTAIKRIRREH